jgi:BlaI family transcriptional regulator, penicillinase repressor
MPPLPRDVTDAELSVLKELWEHGSQTIRQLTDRVYPGGGASEYATTQKLLERLEAKDCVRRAKDSTPHRFTALLDRENLIGRRLQEVADTLCDGSVTPLLTHLLHERSLSALERKALHDLVDALTRSPKLKNPKR